MMINKRPEFTIITDTGGFIVDLPFDHHPTQ